MPHDNQLLPEMTIAELSIYSAIGSEQRLPTCLMLL